MDCFCGCGAKVSRRLVETNLQAGRVAVELLAWDKARAEGRLSGNDSERVESLIGQGASGYRRLLSALHGERQPNGGAELWLEESFEERKDRRHMTTAGSLLTQPKLQLDETDFERLDRLHPETSFSGQRRPGAEPPPAAAAGPAAADGAEEPLAEHDLVARLERLGDLHSRGLLTAEEFAVAKSRLLAGG